MTKNEVILHVSESLKNLNVNKVILFELNISSDKLEASSSQLNKQSAVISSQLAARS